MSSNRLTNTIRERYIYDVVSEMPNSAKQFGDDLVDGYWELILSHAATEFDRVKLTEIYDQIKLMRDNSGSNRIHRFTYVYYVFRESGNLAEPVNYYGPGIGYGQRIVVCTKPELEKLNLLTRKRSAEVERVSEFTSMLRTRAYSVTTTRRLKEILPQFEKHIPT